MPIKEIDVDEVYGKNPELKKEEVTLLKQWVEKQGHLPNITEFQAALFLHSCFFRQEAAKTAIDIYFTMRTLSPDLFQYRTYKDPGVQAAIHHNLMVALPMPNGDTVILAHPSEIDYFVFANDFKTFDAELQMYLHRNGPTQGLHIIVDMKNVTFPHLIKLSASVMNVKKFLYILQEGLPVRMKYLHFINIVSFMDKLLALIKPFMKKELLENLVLHPNIETIFEYIPQEVFPKDYGGSAESIEVLRENSIMMFKENEEFLNIQDRQLVDESKRSGPPNSVNETFGVEGSFKKLDFD